MEVSALAALGTALGVYFYSRSKSGGEEEACVPKDTHVNSHSAPQSLWDELYFFAEGLKYTYGETLGRWRTADLLIGLVSNRVIIRVARRTGARRRGTASALQFCCLP
jgi:hypothetical protein